MALVLYQRDDCHLCDQAVEVLAQARAGEFSSVFIDGDAALESAYGERVPAPVLPRPGRTGGNRRAGTGPRPS
ncbi:hypothetical protein XarbCFBP8152_20975, partial [Xanthomonas arboricola]